MCYYIMYDIPVKLQKTRRWFPTSFLIYTFENLGCDQVGGLENQDKLLGSKTAEHKIRTLGDDSLTRNFRSHS